MQLGGQCCRLKTLRFEARTLEARREGGLILKSLLAGETILQFSRAQGRRFSAMQGFGVKNDLKTQRAF